MTATAAVTASPRAIQATVVPIPRASLRSPEEKYPAAAKAASSHLRSVILDGTGMFAWRRQDVGVWAASSP